MSLIKDLTKQQILKHVCLPGMDIQSALSEKSYYNNYSRKFTHHYDVYYTNIDKIDRIVIESLQKGFQLKVVFSMLDEIWNECIQREDDYRGSDGDPITSHEATFELYLRNVLRKILVFDEFQKVFASV